VFKKIFICLFVFCLTTGILFARDRVYFEKIGSIPNSEFDAKFAVVVNFDDYIVKLDEIIGSEGTYKFINDRTECNKIDYSDITGDGTDDVVISILIGRGISDMFYVVDGKSHKVIFNHRKCRKNIGKDLIRIGCEGRGGRSFKYSKGKVEETVEIPFCEKIPPGLIEKLKKNPKSTYYKWNYDMIREVLCINAEKKIQYHWDESQQQFVLMGKSIRKFYQDKGNVYL